MTTEIQLPPTGFLRTYQILGNPKANPPILPLIPIGRTTWWRWVRSGKIKAYKLSPRITAFKVEDIRLLIQSM